LRFLGQFFFALFRFNEYIVRIAEPLLVSLPHLAEAVPIFQFLHRAMRGITYMKPAPEACREVSPARERWVKIEESPERQRRDRSSENVSRVVFNAVLLQQRNEFLFKRHFAVMPFLILNVPHDRRNIRLAYPESAVPLLPGKPSELVGHPSRRVRLYVPNGIGNDESSWKLQQHMNMVLHPANSVDKDVLVLANPGGVRP
jgi:hypothetical protein